VSTKLALVTGVGPGTGASIVRRFAMSGYYVAMIARNEQRLRKFESEIDGTKAFPVDVTDTARFAENARSDLRRSRIATSRDP